MKWKLGKCGGTIVSDAPYADCRTLSSEAAEFYGGFLVAESIPHPDLANIIKAAPKLLEACRTVEAGLSNGEGSIPFMITMLQSAIWEAEGRLA